MIRRWVRFASRGSLASQSLSQFVNSSGSQFRKMVDESTLWWKTWKTIHKTIPQIYLIPDACNTWHVIRDILYQHAHWNCQKSIWRKWLEVFICTHTLFECFGILYLLTIRAARCKRLILMSFPSWHSTRPRFVRKSRLPKRYTKRYLRFRFARHPSFSTVYNNLRVNHLCLKYHFCFKHADVCHNQHISVTVQTIHNWILTFPFCQTFFFQHCLQQPPGKSSLFKEIISLF